jgi:hypothetical protein
MNSYSIYQSHLDAIFEEAGDTPAEWLVNFAGKAEVEEEKRKWQQFLDLSGVRDNFLPGQDQSFRDMFENYQQFRRIHEGEAPDLSLEQERLLEFDSLMDEYGKYFSPNPESSDDYFKLRDQAYAALSGVKSEMGKGVSWWFDTVSKDYYNKRDELYKKLDKTNDRDKALVYQEIRQMAAQYDHPWKNPSHPKWGVFPSPEEYVFLRLGPRDREQQVAEWANLPATFLTEFQREKVGYSIPEGKQDEANKLASLITKGNYRFNKAVVQNDLSYSSTAVKNSREQFDQFYAQQAKKMGLDDYWKELNQPEYQRIGHALNLGERTGAWAWAADAVDELRKRVEDAGYSADAPFPTDIVKAYQKWTVDAFALVRKQDRKFDAILNELSVALGEDGQPLTHDDLILKLFWGSFSTSSAYYLD